MWYWALIQGGGFGNATVSLQSASMSRCLLAIVTDFNAPQGSFLSDHCNYRCLKNLCTVNILQRQQSPSFAKSPLNPQKCQNYHKWPKTPKKRKKSTTVNMKIDLYYPMTTMYIYEYIQKITKKCAEMVNIVKMPKKHKNSISNPSNKEDNQPVP